MHKKRVADHRDAYANGAKRRAFREACSAGSSEVRSVLCHSPAVASNPGSGSTGGRFDIRAGVRRLPLYIPPFVHGEACSEGCGLRHDTKLSKSVLLSYASSKLAICVQY